MEQEANNFSTYPEDAELDPYGEQSLEALEAKLAENRDSLATVREALALSPDEPELITLVKDLEELVHLYQDLVEFRRVSEATKFTGAENAPDVEDHHATASAPGLLSKTDADGFAGVAEKETSSLEESGAKLVIDLSHNLLRRTCYAYYEGELYTAVVVEVLETETPPRVKVEYIGWGNQEILPIHEVQFLPLVSLSNSICRPGGTCWAISDSDGLWRSTVIMTVSDTEVRVRFPNAKDAVSVPLDRVSLSKPAHCLYETAVASSNTAAMNDGKKRKKVIKEIITPGGYRIPDSLRINPQDSERVRQIKKKKITLLKKEQRRELVEQEARNRQNTWKAHAAATAKKSKLFVKSQSIFTTSDAPDAKVGVTGSGKGMTQFVTRLRHVFHEEDDDDV